LEAAGRVSRKKPVIVMKTGRSTAGARAALSHSGSLVGEDHVFDAAFKRAGILRVRTSGEMKDAMHALAVLGEMEGPRLGVVTVTGAGGIMCADACEDHGLTIGALPPGLAARLKQGIPDWIHVSNPLDIWPIGMIGGHYAESYRLSLAELLKSDGIDGVLAVFPVTESPLHTDLKLEAAFAGARLEAGNRKPIAAWPYMDVIPAIDSFEAISGVACFDTIEQAVRALSYCHQTHRLKNRHRPQPRSFAVNETAAAELVRKGKKEGMLVGQDALRLLAIYGIPAVAGAETKSLAALQEAAKGMKPPYVLKLSGRVFLHKSEWGGIVTGIDNLSGLKAAHKQIVGNVRAKDPGVSIDAFQIQEQIPGKEILLGLKRDPVFGHVMACGLGGIYTEVFRDVSREIVPVDGATARAMIESLRIWPLLKGARGEPGIDVDALVEIIERLSFFASQNPDIAELDINPVMSSASGSRAVDARIIWG
jgi:acyl-CoA synthetase (NDP forming)